MAVSIKRLRSLATIALVNSLVIFITLFSDWTLQEATLAYLGELVVLVVLICLRVLLAKRLPGDEIGRFRWRLVGAKLLAIGISLPLYAFVVGVTLLMLFGNSIPFDEGIPLPESTLRGLILCWTGFLVAHLLGFIEQFGRGVYDELISDERVMAQLWRYPPLLLAAIAVAVTTKDGVAIAPSFFIAALAFMAIVDSAIYISEQDAVNATVRRIHWLSRKQRELI
jgi:hypothetical protein